MLVPERVISSVWAPALRPYSALPLAVTTRNSSTESVLVAVIARPRRGATASFTSMPSRVLLLLPWRSPLTCEKLVSVPVLEPFCEICTPGWKMARVSGVRASCGSVSMSRMVTAALTWASVVATVTAFAATSITSVSLPTSSFTSCAMLAETANSISVTVVLEKPGASTVNV